MKKIIEKISFIFNIVFLGANLSSRIILFYNVLRIQKNMHLGGTNKTFSTSIAYNGKIFFVHFQGTMDELHSLTEIFIDKCYKTTNTKVERALDLGANIGLASLWIYAEFNAPIIHAYEPNPDVFKILKINLKQIPTAVVFNKAISVNSNPVNFYVSSRSFSSSLFKIEDTTCISIPSETIDEAIRIIGDKVDFIKMDIEGAEFEVINNMKKLSKINVIIGEIHPEKANEDVSRFYETLSKTHKISGLSNKKSLFTATLK